MELRKKSGWVQRIVESAVRFRLVLLALLIPLWAVFSLSWTDFITQLLGVAEVNGQMVFDLLRGEIPLKSLLLGPIFGVLLLFLLRGKFFGWRNGLVWLGSVLALVLLMFLLEGSEPVLAVVVMAILVVAVTLFFFVKSLVAIALLPLLLLAYGLSTWLMALHVTPVGWQGVMALFLADSLVLLVAIGHDLRAGRPVSGSVTGNMRKQLPVILVSAGGLMLAEVFFFYLGAPIMGAATLSWALGIYFSYVVWMLAVWTPVLSFCPLGRIRAARRSVTTGR